MERVVRVGDPRHLALTRADVGRRNVFTRSDVFLANQLRGETAGDFFDLFRSVFFGTEANTAFGPAEWHVHDRAFVRHQRGQGHDFVGMHHFAVADASLHRLTMLTVFGAPAFEDLIVIAAKPDRKLEIVKVIASLDLTQKPRVDLKILSGAIELLRNDAVEIEVFFYGHRYGHRLSPGQMSLLGGFAQQIALEELGPKYAIGIRRSPIWNIVQSALSLTSRHNGSLWIVHKDVPNWRSEC